MNPRRKEVALEFPFNGPWQVIGNTAKIAFLCELLPQVVQGGSLDVLDVGCIGLQTLDFWKPFLLKFDNLNLTGIVIRGIESGRTAISKKAVPH